MDLLVLQAYNYNITYSSELSSGEFEGVGYPRIEGSSKITFKGLGGRLGSTYLEYCHGSTGLGSDVGGGLTTNPFLGGPLILRGPIGAPTGLGCGICRRGCDIIGRRLMGLTLGSGR